MRREFRTCRTSTRRLGMEWLPRPSITIVTLASRLQSLISLQLYEREKISKSGQQPLSVVCSSKNGESGAWKLKERRFRREK
jgi:hypothetical protein